MSQQEKKADLIRLLTEGEAGQRKPGKSKSKARAQRLVEVLAVMNLPCYPPCTGHQVGQCLGSTGRALHGEASLERWLLRKLLKASRLLDQDRTGPPGPSSKAA